MPVSAGERVEDALARGESDVLAVEKLAHGGVVGDTDYFAGHFDLEMKVADHPAEAGGGGGVGAEGDFEDGFVFLREDVGGGGAVKNSRAVGERGFEVEAEFLPVFGDAAPAAFREGEAFDGDASDGQGALPGERVVDELHPA